MASSPKRSSRELRRLIWTELTDGLSPAMGQQLRDLLLSDSSALSEYVAYTRLLADVRGMASSELQPSSIAVEKRNTSPMLQLRSWVSEAVGAIKLRPRRASLWSIAIAVNAIVVVLLSIAVAPRFIQRQDLARPQIEESKAITTAKLISAADCNWTGDVPTVGSVLSARTLSLRSGLAHLEFGGGAQVVIEGPCELELQTPGSGHLRRGSLVARVPQQAIGFTIQTANATVVDLGTEFGVEVNQSGTTEVQVFKGKIELQPRANPSDSSPAVPAITLGAGMARRIEVSQGRAVVVQNIEAKPSRIAKQLLAAKSKRLIVSGAMASSEFQNRGANNLVNGSGMHGEQHDNNAEAGTMWLSDGSRIEGEYILFDLGKPSRIESLKVWNYNESANKTYASRGVKHADIYVSDTGKNDPLSNPRDWRLVIADQKFSAADGTGSYSTPDTIVLGDTEARFLAIVIKERWGDDRTQPTKHYVGLSEVQFFGERIPNEEIRMKK